MGAGTAAAIAIPLIGGAISGYGANQDAKDANRERQRLEALEKDLRNLADPTLQALQVGYRPGGRYEQLVQGLYTDQANTQRAGAEAAGRGAAYRTGGIRSGAPNRAGRDSGWMNTLAQGLQKAPLAANQRRGGLALAQRGQAIRDYEYSDSRSPWTALGTGVTSFGRAYDQGRRPTR